MTATRIMLDEKAIPTHWYNAVADMPNAPLPLLLFNLSGHGRFDMASYDRYFAGKLEDYEYPSEAVAASLAHLPKVS